VTQQYPGYRIARRVEVADQWKSGFAGVTYVLTAKRTPRFRLLVSLAELAPEQTLADAPEGYLAAIGRVVTSDALFSADAKRSTEYLSGGAQNAIVDAFLASGVKPGGVAFRGFGDEGTLAILANTGDRAVERAIATWEDADYIVEGALPEGANNTRVELTAQKW
ncbi:MAG: hypothetical protein HGB10_11005, partial [Coriobacteriia bacterium]|nr:hypothetical protein [Coriobacteriia bacterium]